MEFKHSPGTVNSHHCFVSSVSSSVPGMCRFCAKFQTGNEDLYASFVAGHDEFVGSDSVAAAVRASPGGLSSAPGSAAWKARRASVESSAYGGGGGDGGGGGASAFSSLPLSSSSSLGAMSRAEKREAELCATLRKRRIPTVLLTGFLGSGKTTLLNRLLRATPLRLAVIENEVGAVSVDDQLIASATATASTAASSGSEPGDAAAAGELGLFLPGKSRAQEVVLMPNGCMCCRVRGDLRDAFKRIVVAAYEAPPALDAAAAAAATTTTSSSTSSSTTAAAPRAARRTRGLDGLVLELSGLSELGPVVQTFLTDPFVRSRVRASQRYDATRRNNVPTQRRSSGDAAPTLSRVGASPALALARLQ